MTDPGLSNKSADAYRTISEVAAELKLPQHVLRFWETRFTQVKPLKRAGGRRFYRPEDVHLLRAVKALLYGDGYTIKGVQRILREQGPRAVAALAASRPREGASRAGAPRPEPDRAPVVTPMQPRPIEPEPPAVAEPTGDPASRLRAVLDDLDGCARLLSDARDAATP